MYQRFSVSGEPCEKYGFQNAVHDLLCVHFIEADAIEETVLPVFFQELAEAFARSGARAGDSDCQGTGFVRLQLQSVALSGAGLKETVADDRLFQFRNGSFHRRGTVPPLKADLPGGNPDQPHFVRNYGKRGCFIVIFQREDQIGNLKILNHPAAPYCLIRLVEWFIEISSSNMARYSAATLSQEWVSRISNA